MNDGELSEYLATVFLSRKTHQGYLFRTVLIAGKWPSIDIYAEIIGTNSPKNYCFIQVKSTVLGYTAREKKLKVKIPKSKLNKLANFNGPSYLIGIDYIESNPFKSKAYISAIRGTYSNGLSSMPTDNLLDENNLVQLRDEVENFWNGTNTFNNKNNTASIFDL
ncbi:hypothetical protein [Ulvibacterium sp.]|uniref:hypothetical protein n=1 Tax=Ulvibacterium sp. TaxID=2665914 RepID=UPI003BA9A501